MNLKRLYRYFKPLTDIRDSGRKGYKAFYMSPINPAEFLNIYIVLPETALKDPGRRLVLDHMFTFKARNGREYLAWRFIEHPSGIVQASSFVQYLESEQESDLVPF